MHIRSACAVFLGSNFEGLSVLGGGLKSFWQVSSGKNTEAATHMTKAVVHVLSCRGLL